MTKILVIRQKIGHSFAKKIGHSFAKILVITKILVIDHQKIGQRLSWPKFWSEYRTWTFIRQNFSDDQNFGPDYGIHAFVYIYTNEHYTNVV